MMIALQQRTAMWLVSAIIVLILGTQLVAGWMDTGRWGWPFLAYPMYKTSHHENERVLYDLDVYAELDDGSRVAITSDAVGMDFWVFWYNVVQPIRYEDRGKLAPVVARYCAETGGQVRKLVALDKGVAVTRAGPQYDLPPTVIYSTSVQCP